MDKFQLNRILKAKATHLIKITYEIRGVSRQYKLESGTHT